MDTYRWWQQSGPYAPIRLSEIVPSTGEPVASTDALEHLRLTETSEQGRVDALISAARSAIEAQSGRRFMKRQVRQVFDRFPRGKVLLLAASPILSTSDLSTGESLVRLRYLTGDSTGYVEWSSTNFSVSAASDPPRLVLRRDQEWPAVELENADAVEVDYWVGYGTTPADTPPWARQAMLLTVGHWFLHREAVVTGTIATVLPAAADSLVMQNRSPIGMA